MVEDEHKIADSIKKGLEQEAYAVDAVYDGQAGFDLAVSEDYDLIILDRLLPGMDGIEIIRRRARCGSSKIIILTDSTAINKSAEGTREDFKTGEKIGVFGTENSDGSITAQNIQLNPTVRFPSSRSQ